MHKAREVFVRNESCNKIRTALNKKVREHKLEEAAPGDEVFYKRENEHEWRGPAKVVGVSGKTVVVKHGDSLREIARVHITRIQSQQEERKEVEDACDEKDEIDRAGERRINSDTQGETDMTMGWREKESRREDSDGNYSEDEWQRDENDTGEELPKLNRGNRVRAVNRDTGIEEEWTILSLAGKRSSKHWADSYNVQDLQTGDKGWINLRDYTNVEKIEDEEEILLGFENNSVREAKEKELKNWRANNVYEEVNDEGQKAISTRWVITEKVKGGETICKARLVARGFEEEMAEWEKDAPTCSAETLKFCLTIIKLKKWTSYTLDVKTAYLQGDEIKREVYLRPPGEGGWNGLWKLKKTVYGLKDAAKA